MKCQQLCDLGRAAVVEPFEGASDIGMIGGAVPLEQAAVGRLLRQPMAKDEEASLRLDPLVDEFETAQFAQLTVERTAPFPYRPQQAKREFTTDHRGVLQQLLGCRRQPIDARHDNAVNGLGDHQIRAMIADFAGVQSELFEKQRVAVGLGDDLLGQRIGETVLSQHGADDVKAVVPGQRLQLDLGWLRFVDPGRTILRAMRSQQQDAGISDILRQKLEQFLGYRVDPMQVLQYQHQRASSASLDAEPVQDVKALGFYRFGVRECRQAGNFLDSQKMQQNRAVLIRIHPDLAQPGMDFNDDGFGRVRLDDPAIAAQNVERERIGNGAAVGQASSLHPGYPAIADPAAEFAHEPRFADARFADDADHLAAAVLDPAQHIVQHGAFALAADKIRHPRRHDRIASGARPGDAEQAIGRDRIGLALEGQRPDRFDARVTLGQCPDRAADQDLSRFGGLLQSGGEVCGVADRGIHAEASADRAKDDRSGMDADPNPQFAADSGVPIAGLAESPSNGEPREQGAPHMVLMGDRRAEQRHKAVAAELRCDTVEAVHFGQRYLDKFADEVVHRLGAETIGKRGRVRRCRKKARSPA